MTLKEQLMELFKDNLETENFSESSNIFDIGGSSIIVYKMSEQAKVKYGLNISPVDLMTYPTLEKLYLFLDKGEKEAFDETRIVTRRNLKNRRQKGI